MKVTRRFTLALIGGILVVHAASAAVLFVRERRVLESNLSRDARVFGRALGHAVEQAWTSGNEARAMELIRYATEQESHVTLRWVWLDAPPGDPHAPAARAEALAPIGLGRSVVLRLWPAESGETLYTYVPVRAPGRRTGAIEIADPLGDEQDYLRESVVNSVVAALALAAICGGLTAILGFRLIGRPVRRLVEHARAVGRGELGTRLELPARDELGTLAAEMDQMTVSLERARGLLEEETRRRIATVEQLRHADRLTSVGQLASGVAHELGTPLNVIEGHAQLIREDSRAATAHEHAQIITRQCKRMTTIIRQLLDFARRGRSGEDVADAREVARETLRMVEPLLRKQAIEANLEDHGEVLATIGAHQLQQVLVNLVVNAIHAMPTGGELTLKVERRIAANLEDGREAERAVITVEDTGEGMAPETVARVFEPFFTTKDVGEGTGLGLSVAFGIVKDHGGWLEVRSEPGRGSAFTCYLPARGAA